MPPSLDIWSRNKLYKIGCQSKIIWRNKGLSDQWAVEPMGCRTNGLSNQWVVGPMGCRTNGLSDYWDVTNIPTAHWFDSPLVRQPTGPTAYWSDNRLC